MYVNLILFYVHKPDKYFHIFMLIANSMDTYIYTGAHAKKKRIFILPKLKLGRWVYSHLIISIYYPSNTDNSEFNAKRSVHHRS